jgi:DNA topoisomerase-1
VRGSQVRFTFRGKSGIEHEIHLDDRRLSRIVRACRDIPGYDLFQCYDENGERQSIGSADVNVYLKEIAGQDYTSKDFRTWAGTVHAVEVLRACGPCRSQPEGKRNIVRAVESVAHRLGNTKAVSRKCYIHPTVFDAYMDGLMTKMTLVRRNGQSSGGLSEPEAAVLSLLQKRLNRQSRPKAV